MSTAERVIGYPVLNLPADVRQPWSPGQEWDMTEAARSFHREPHRWKGIRVKAMSGGFGGSKTVTFTAEGIFCGFRNPGQTGVLLEPTFPLVRDALAPALNQRLEDFGLVRNVDWTFSKSEWIWRVLGGAEDGGFTILARSGTEWERIIAMNLAWIGLDEPGRMPREAFTMSRTRVRVGVAQEVFLTGTPDIGSWYASLIAEPPEGMEIFTAPTSGNPWIEQSYIDAMRQEFDAKSLEAYLEGKPVALTGNAYHAFTEAEFPDGNMRPWTYDPERPVVLDCDNNRDPLAAVLAQEDGRLLCYFDAVALRGGSWAGLAESVHAKLGGKPPKGFILGGDAVLRGAVVDSNTKMSTTMKITTMAMCLWWICAANALTCAASCATRSQASRPCACVRA